MELVIKIQLQTETKLLDKYIDHDPEFEHEIDMVKFFSVLYGFDLDDYSSFCGHENDKFYPLCEIGYTFNLSKRFSGADMFLVSSAITTFANYHGFKLSNESLLAVDDE